MEDTQESNHAGLRRFLPRSEQGLTLFTTRSSRVANYLTCYDIVEVSAMDERKAMKVLRNLLINKDLLKDVESTKQLLERLTYLPLAIVQAASFMNENLTDIKTYSRLLDGRAEALFKEGLEKARKTIGPEHPSVVWNTEQLALVIKYQNRYSEAIELMTETARLHEAAFGASYPTTVRFYRWIDAWSKR